MGLEYSVDLGTDKLVSIGFVHVYFGNDHPFILEPSYCLYLLRVQIKYLCLSSFYLGRW